MASDDLIRTALTDRHESRGARIAPFAGWAMPIEFEGTIAEHEAVRSSVGVFDVSHLGTVWVMGSGAEDKVAGTFTNDPRSLDGGGSQYTLCCNDDGGIIDDLILYRLATNRFLTIPNAANTAAVVGALSRDAALHGVEVRDDSTDFAIVAVQGPESPVLVRDALGLDIDAIPYLSATEVELGGETVLLCRTGYTGEVGCELVIPNAAAGGVWDALLDAGATPAGLGARDTLRLEMGYPLHGNDITTSTDPYEAGLGWAVKLDRGTFTGQEALRARKEAGPRRRLHGLLGEGRRPPRAGMRVLSDGEEVGTVTSGSFSPTLTVGLGLAYLDARLGPGDHVTVDIRGTEVGFDVVKPPFVDRSPKG